MRLYQIILAAALSAAVSACSSKAQFKEVVTVQVVKPDLPPAARAPCDAPVLLPDRDLTSREATGFWGKDRSALAVCEQRRAAAVSAVNATPVPAERPVQP